MKKFFILITAVLTAMPAYCGTLIYKNSQKEKKIISEIDIVAIDKNIFTIQIGKTTRTIPYSNVIKYYDTDINLNLSFDDNTADYDIYASHVKMPMNNKGITVHKGGKKAGKQVNKVTVDYSIQMKKLKNQSNAIKAPYFYLYVLTSSSNNSGTSLYCFSYPEKAKIRNTKNYNEALMLEKVLSSERHNHNADYVLHGNGIKKANNTATFELTGIGNREIIAYRLVVWGKDDIIFEKNEILNMRYNISKHWYLHAKNQK